MKRLSQLKPGETSKIIEIPLNLNFLLERGFYPEESISVVSYSPQRDKLVVDVSGSTWALETKLCDLIIVK